MNTFETNNEKRVSIAAPVRDQPPALRASGVHNSPCNRRTQRGYIGFTRVERPEKSQGVSKGFTLVELLVVIAIIAILASLTFPSVTKARGRAESATCKSNLRQVTAAALLYSADNDGEMPTSRHWNGAPQYISVLQDYIEERGTNAVARGVWICPTHYKFIQSNYNYNYFENYTYSENFQLHSRKPGGGNLKRVYQATTMLKALRPGRSASNRKAPNGYWPTGASTIPYFMDGQINSTKVYNWRKWEHNEPEERRFPHNWTCNMSFLDGHVEATKRWEGIWSRFQPNGGLTRPTYEDGAAAF